MEERRDSLQVRLETSGRPHGLNELVRALLKELALEGPGLQSSCLGEWLGPFRDFLAGFAARGTCSRKGLRLVSREVVEEWLSESRTFGKPSNDVEKLFGWEVRSRHQDALEESSDALGTHIGRIIGSVALSETLEDVRAHGKDLD